MKKLSILLALLLAMTLFASCGSSTDAPAGSDAPQESAAAAEGDAPATAAVTDPTAPAGTFEGEGAVTIWTWNVENAERATQFWQPSMPNVTFSVVSADDYLQKVQTSVASGLELPDVFMLERAERGAIFELDVLDDLEQAPYNVKREWFLDGVVEGTLNSDGVMVSLEGHQNPAGLAYKRALAIEYLGTDDPAELEAMMPTWDEFVTVGEDVLAKSGGAIRMAAGLSDLREALDYQSMDLPFYDPAANKWVNLDAIFGESFATMAKMRDAGILDKLATWSTGWYDNFAQDNTIFFPCAIWIPEFVIQHNDAEGHGEWGIMVPPDGGYNWGGTGYGIWKDSENKEAAWHYIKSQYLSPEGYDENATVGYFSNTKAFYDAGVDYTKYPNPWFEPQQFFQFLLEEISPNISVRVPTQYDVRVVESMTFVTNEMEQNPELDAAAAMEMFRAELANRIPEVSE